MSNYTPYLGQKAASAQDPATEASYKAIPLNIVLTVVHGRALGLADINGLIALVDHMTPGVVVGMENAIAVLHYAGDVCVSELRAQFPEIASLAPPEHGNLDPYYDQMVARFGETVLVRSLPKPTGW